MKRALHHRYRRQRPTRIAPRTAPETRPAISVIVPARNAAHQLPLCLQAVAASSFRNFEVLVVDDASSDGSHEVALAFGARCLRTRRQLGPAGARNLGARNARGELLVFVDADVLLPPDALELLTEDFTAHPAVAAVFGSYDDAPAESNFLSQYKNLFHHYVHQRSRPEASTFWSGCGAVRKHVFDRVGGFDELAYSKPSIEDIELGGRIRQAGYDIRLDKRIQARHLKRWTPLQLLRTDIRDRAIPWSRLILRAGSMPSDLNLTYSARASVSLSLMLAICVAWLGAAVWMKNGASQIAAAALLVISGALLILNRDLYRFFLRKRGLAFALGTIPAHWLYFMYSGLAWILCCVEHLVRIVSVPVKADRARRPADPTVSSTMSAGWMNLPAQTAAAEVSPMAAIGRLPVP